jgi:hypothetical protein
MAYVSTGMNRMLPIPPRKEPAEVPELEPKTSSITEKLHSISHFLSLQFNFSSDHID